MQSYSRVMFLMMTSSAGSSRMSLTAVGMVSLVWRTRPNEPQPKNLSNLVQSNFEARRSLDILGASIFAIFSKE